MSEIIWAFAATILGALAMVFEAKRDDLRERVAKLEVKVDDLRVAREDSE